MKKNVKKTSISMLLGAMAIPFIANFAYAQDVASDVKEQSVKLPISFSKEVNKFNITQLTGTKKLVIDFYDVKDTLLQEPTANNALISNVNSKTFGDRLRVIVDVTGPVKYSLNKDGNNVILSLDSSNKFEEVKQPVVSEKIDTSVNQPITVSASVPVNMPVKPTTVDVKDTNFTPVANIIPTILPKEEVTPIQTNKVIEIEHIGMKKDNNTIKVSLDLNNANINPVFKKENSTLILDLKGVNLPPEFQKLVNTQSFGGVLKAVDIGTQAGSARFVFQTANVWDYSAYQLDKKFVIEFKLPTEKVEQSLYKGKPLSLNFQNMDVRGILQVIADFTNLNIMASDSVQGSMSIRLKDVPWDQALNLVLESKNLTQIKEGNVVWIATAQEISDKNKSKLEIKNQLTELEPLKLEFFQLNHYNAKEMKNVLEGKSDGSSGASAGSSPASGSGANNTKIFLSTKGSIGLDIRNNTIFVQDTDERLKAIESIIRKLDTPVRQVLIEAKLVVATDSFQKQLGAQFGLAGRTSVGNNSIALGSTQSQSQQQAGFVPSSTSNGNSTSGYTFSNAWSSPVAGGGSLGFTILNAVTGNALSAEISALEDKSLAKVISSPKILTADNKKALIQQGTEVPYTIPGTSTTPATVGFKDALLKLGVTPQISPNGRVVMDLDISKDDIGQWVSLPGGGSVPSIDTRSINTQVTVNDGQTVMLGGIYEVTTSDDVSKVPLFGDIPFIGNLFKNTNKQNKKVELVIMITPHIINDADLDAIDKTTPDITTIDMDKDKKSK